MPNIHAINAQGTEYGITAENGITQAQIEKINTIGNASELATEHKQTLVSAINEIYTPTQQSAPTVTLDESITVGAVIVRAPTMVGKIAFIPIEISNVAGANIGTYLNQSFIKTSLRIAREVSCYGQDYNSGSMVRFLFRTNGDIDIGESLGVQSGNNEIRLTAIIPLV